LGLSVRLPSAWSLRRHAFQAGKTSLEFEQKLGSIECVRWGFAEQLLRQHEFEHWARAALDLEKATCVAEAEGLRLSHARLAKSVEAIAALQEDRNQIVTVKLTQVRASSRPEWEWLAC
jgi:hypothetical protein